jgi:hypothetical protein
MNSSAMIKQLMSLLIIPVLISCNSGSKKLNQGIVDSKTDSTTVILMEDRTKSLTTDSILVDNRIQHEFSSSIHKDEFHLYIKGSSIQNGTAVLEIKDYQGNTLFREEYISGCLVDYGFDINDTISTHRDDYIKKRVADFFNEKNFRRISDLSDDTFKANLITDDIVAEIRLEKNSLSFFYNICEGDSRGYVYSKKLKKIIQFYACC